jgi:hypothetical protein
MESWLFADTVVLITVGVMRPTMKAFVTLAENYVNKLLDLCWVSRIV